MTVNHFTINITRLAKVSIPRMLKFNNNKVICIDGSKMIKKSKN